MHARTGFVSRSPAATRRFGETLGRRLRPGDVVYLTGELGSGKTTLVQGIARGLGMKGSVRSSSFVLASEYQGKNATLYHLDLYRLEGTAVEDRGIDEYIFGNGICVIEWAEKIRKIVPRGASYDIRLTWQGEKQRKIEAIEHREKRTRVKGRR